MKRIGLFLIAAMMISILPTMADNFAPPDYAGDPLSYHAEWEFLTQPLPPGAITPDLESNGGPKAGEFLYDKFGTHIDVDGPGWEWDAGGMVNNDRDAWFAINAINWVDMEPEKFIRVQITHIGAAPSVAGAHGYWFNGYHNLEPQNGTTHLGYFDAGAVVIVDSTHLYSDIVMQPNPDWEQIEIFVPMGTIIDEIVIDSISIPEPSAIIMVLMSCGGLLFVRRRLMM